MVTVPRESAGRVSDTMSGRVLRWPSTSLRVYLVAVILLATLPMAILMGMRTVNDVNEQRERMRQSLQSTAATLARSIEREIASTGDALMILSHSEWLQQGDIAQFERSLRARPLPRPGWSSTFLATPEGQVLFDTALAGPPDSAVGLAQTRAFERLQAGQDLAISGLARDALGGGYGTNVQIAVRSDGSLRYVLGARIGVEAWQDLLEKTAPGGGFASIFDREHVLIARTPALEPSIGLPLDSSTISGMQDQASGYHRTELPEGGDAYEAWHSVAPAQWGVSAAVAAAPYDAAHRGALLIGLATAAGSLIAGLLLALLAARGLTRPLHQLATTGTTRPLGGIAVREVAMLREALASAQAQDQAVRERLQAKADEFQILFESSPIGMGFAQDSQSRVVLHNPAMDRLLGGPDAVADGTVRVLHRGRPVPLAEMPLQRAAAQGATITAFEMEIVAQGRPPAYVLVNAVPLRDPHGQTRGAVCAMIDITERKLTEARLISVDQRLRESQRLVDLAQEAGRVGFFHYLFSTDVLSWTPGQAKLFGMESVPVDATLEDWAHRIADEDRTRVEETLRTLLQQRRQKETIEFRVRLPDGSWRWLSSRLLINYSPENRPQQMVGVTVDMTDEIEAERERVALVEREQAARLEAEAANRSKDEFLAMLGHELRNPLSAIASAVEVLNRVDAQAEVAVQARNIIARQTRRLADMMDDLLDVARVISGKVALTRQPIDLAGLVQRTAATLQLTGASARHSLQFALDEVWIDADATRIEQVVTNLLTNALKYTPPGGHVQVQVSREGEQARLEVRDDGGGIPPSLLPRIFDLFVQGERPLDRRTGGLGIGLTLARRLVELHGGTIGAESDASGSRFTVLLPATGAPDKPQPPQPEVRTPSAMKMAVIEDNDDVLDALRTTLELDGNQVATANDGARGLELLLECRPDVAIVDIGLPELTGYEIARRCREAGYTGRLIAISGYGQASDVRKALDAGFDAHLVKPVDMDLLHKLLAQ
jgi:PAS domain S-box-containing protein